MRPVKFPGATHSLGAPLGWDTKKHGSCEALPVMVVNRVCISCWELTDEERQMVAEGKNIYVRVVDGQRPATQPPMKLSVEE